MDLYVRVHHRSTYRESIDVSDVTADGVCGYITDAMIFGDSRSDHAKQELRFIHSSVISSYSLMREVYRTVKELDLRILYCSLECELHLHGGSRNDEICTVLCCSLNSFLELLFCILAVTSQSLNDAGENFLEIFSTFFVTVYPTGLRSVTVVKEEYLERILLRVCLLHYVIDDRNYSLLLKLRLLRENDLVTVRTDTDLFPDE